MRRLAHCALLLLLVASCTKVRRARAAIDEGSFETARQLLQQHLEKNPDDVDAKLMLAEIELREAKVSAAKIRLADLSKNPDLTFRISQMFRDEAHKLDASGDANALTAAALEAVRLNPLAATDMCGVVMGRARREQGKNWYPLIAAAVTIDTECRDKAIALLRSWIDNADVKTARVEDIMEIAKRLRDIDASGSMEIARAVRTLTRKMAAEDRFKADTLYRRLGEIDYAIYRDPETQALQRITGPIEVREDPTPDNGSDSHFDNTKRVLEQVGTLLVAYQQKNNRYPAANTIDELLTALGSAAAGNIDPYDGWGQPLHYVSNGTKARLISSGADRSFDPASSNLDVPASKANLVGMDVIWENGVIVQAPEGWH